MAYDSDLAERLRPLVAEAAGALPVEEKRMFGGLAFLVASSLSVSVSSQGGLLVRVDPAEHERLLAEPGAEEFEMRGRGSMRGWLRVAPDVLSDGVLEAGVARGVAAAEAASH